MQASGRCCPNLEACSPAISRVWTKSFAGRNTFAFSVQRMPCWTTSIVPVSTSLIGKTSFSPNCWHCPAGPGLMRRLEEDPSLAPHEPVPCSLMDFLAVRLTMARVASRMGVAEAVPQESPLKTQEKRRLSRAARVYDAARVVSLSADEVTRLSRYRVGGLCERGESMQWVGAPPHPSPGL